MKLYKYDSAELSELQQAITKELHDRQQSVPDHDYLETVTSIRRQDVIDEAIATIDWSTITKPIKISHWSTNNLYVEQTVEKIGDEYLIKTTEYDDCEDSDPDHYDEDDNFITQETVISKYYVSVPLLRAFIAKILK